ncbi:class I SAM-dependent methyltransferase [bacterium]|nr:class I SAM-dependent methyltransferase [bacterium]
MNLKFYIGAAKVPPGMRLLEVEDQNSLEKHAACRVCGSENFPEVMKLQSKKGSAYISRGYCTTCGYFGTYNYLSQAWVDDYYRKDWSNTPQTLQYEMDSVWINEWTYSFISKYVPDKKAYILDAGAGFGTSIRGFVSRGYENVQALELSERRVKVLKSKYPVVVDSIPIQNLQSSKVLAKQFDAIYSWHVLEHLSQLNECLEVFNQSIKNDGYLFLAVPNFQDEHFGMLLNLYVHLHSFQESTLKYLLSKYGFTHVETLLNSDSKGIRAIFKKTGPVQKSGDASHLLSPQKYRDIYHDKVFKDFQLMYLGHQPKWTHKNVLLTFHLDSSFAGSCLHGYPLKKSSAIAYKEWDRSSNAHQKKPNFINRTRRKVADKWIRYRHAIPPGSMLFDRIEGIPEDVSNFLSIYNTNDLIKMDFIHSGDHLKLWCE